VEFLLLLVSARPEHFHFSEERSYGYVRSAKCVNAYKGIKGEMEEATDLKSGNYWCVGETTHFSKATSGWQRQRKSKAWRDRSGRRTENTVLFRRTIDLE